MSEKRTKHMGTIKKVLAYIKHYKWLVLISVFLAAVTVIATLYFPILTGNAIDCIVSRGQVDFAGIWSVIKKMFVVIAITAFAQWLQNICNNKITYQVIRDVRADAFKKIEKLPLKYIDDHSYGEVVSRVIADVDQFADGLLMGFTQLFTEIGRASCRERV